MLCSSNGEYEEGACRCYPGWKGAECSIRHNECEVPDCNNHGNCVAGECQCSRGYTGQFCQLGESLLWSLQHSLSLDKVFLNWNKWSELLCHQPTPAEVTWTEINILVLVSNKTVIVHPPRLWCQNGDFLTQKILNLTRNFNTLSQLASRSLSTPAFNDISYILQRS